MNVTVEGGAFEARATREHELVVRCDEVEPRKVHWSRVRGTRFSPSGKEGT